jgi:ferric-dicitrate binding protein FerR (iron transport regulator)
MNEEVNKPDAGSKGSPNNQPFVSWSKLTYTKADSLVVETAWVQNKLVFDNESFEEVAVKMERWYNMEIVFRDVKIKAVRMSGTFENETIQQALDGLAIIAPFHYSIQGNKVIIGR